MTLQQIGDNLQTALLHARTDFLLQQSQLWQQLNDGGNKSDAFVKPSNLDLAQSKFEFYITPKVVSFLVKFYFTLFRIPMPKARFRLCGKEVKNSIKVSIEIRIQADQQLNPEIITEPDLKPRETYVTDLTF